MRKEFIIENPTKKQFKQFVEDFNKFYKDKKNITKIIEIRTEHSILGQKEKYIYSYTNPRYSLTDITLKTGSDDPLLLNHKDSILLQLLMDTTNMGFALDPPKKTSKMISRTVKGDYVYELIAFVVENRSAVQMLIMSNK